MVGKKEKFGLRLGNVWNPQTLAEIGLTMVYFGGNRMSKKNNQIDALAISKEYIHVSNKKSKIPAILWGEKSDKILIEVHGDLSNKEDTIISIMAEIEVAKVYQVLIFDLQGHAD